MKNSIWEYIDLTAEEKKSLGENGIFVFDTNVLLNLYRYSNKTRNKLIKTLEAHSNQIWIPHQVAYEFMKNRCEVIYDVCAKYDTFEKDKERFLNKAKDLLHDSDEEIQPLRETLNKWIESSKLNNLQVKNPNEDVILQKVLNLFNGKTGTRYDSGKIAELIKEGEKRFSEKRPPGYEDSKKISDTCDNNTYGDFFIWKQIIEYATENHKDIIYVTSEQKDDWWYKVKGKMVGPRVELRKEFCEATKQRFHIYSMNSFLKYYTKNDDESVIEEVKRVEAKRKQYKTNHYSNAEIIRNYIDQKNHNIDYKNFERFIEEIKRIDPKINQDKQIHYSKEVELQRNLCSEIEAKMLREQHTIDLIMNKYAGSGDPLPRDVQTQIDNIQKNIKMYKIFLNDAKSY